MKKKIMILFFLIAFTLKIQAQKKKWYNNYWAGANVGLLLGNNNQSPNFGYNAGRKVGKFQLGIDYQQSSVSTFSSVKIISAYFDKSIKDKKNQLFFYVMPGISYLKDPKTNFTKFSSYQFKNSTPGFNFQFGSGIRWNVKNHSFYLSGGYSISNYSLFANEFPLILNPYNPSVEETVVHKYHFRYNKIQIKLGFQL
jgi:hypothetical protein